MELSGIEVSVVIPVRNEEKYIKKCIESVIAQDYPKDKLEIIFIDGGSEDNTVNIIDEYIKKNDNIRLFKNPNKFIQYALNIGINNSNGKYIIRMDAHAEFSNDYISKCVECLEKTDAIKVGGPMTVKGQGGIQNVIAAAYESPFAMGGANHHKNDYEGYVQAVPWGAFKKDKLLDIGLYDERLCKTEDDDMHMRILKSGGKIYITPEIKGIYYPRNSYKSLSKQYFDYGMWKVAVIKKHKFSTSIFHFIPALFVLSLILLILLSFCFNAFAYLLIGEILLYLILNMYFSFSVKSLNKMHDKLRLVLVNFIIHVSYGYGFLVGIFKFWNFK